MSPSGAPLHVTLVATPDAQAGPLTGLFETLTSFGLLASFERDVPRRPFDVEIVAPGRDAVSAASGLPLGTHRAAEEVERTDVAIVPLMMPDTPEWETGRYPGIVAWLRDRHRDGTLLASACTGVLLLAETGLLESREATIHWAFAPTFRRNFPDVRLRVEETLIVAGDRRELVMTGGVMSWHDLALHLIARFVGPSAAHAMARLLMLEWHGDGQAPYIDFAPRRDHGDAAVAGVQAWLEGNVAVPNPVSEMADRSGLARRTFARRFREATGRTPMDYVQGLRVAAARRRLERTDESIEAIARAVGYANTSFFRRVFKRTTRLTPGAYRRKFGMEGL